MIWYFVFVGVLIAALAWYRQRALRRFNSDPAQRQLAAMLAGLAAGRRGASEKEVIAHLDAISTSKANRRARLIHAVLLARTGASSELYRRMLELSRRLR